MTASPIVSVLFCCTSNAIRSVMAAEIARWLTRGRVYVDSCGARPGEPDGFVIAVLDEIGLDGPGDPPKGFRDLEDSNFDLIVALSPEAYEEALKFSEHLAVEVEYWPSVDPSLVEGKREHRLEAYRRTRDEISQKIAARLSGASAPVV